MHADLTPAAGAAVPAIDLAPVIEAVARSLRGTVPPARIEGVLRDLLAHDFVEARVLAYVPILLQRAACDRLRSPPAAATPTPPEMP